jgi:hypothetical protein
MVLTKKNLIFLDSNEVRNHIASRISGGRSGKRAKTWRFMLCGAAFPREVKLIRGS